MTLIERLTELTGPCRECDALIAIAFQASQMEKGKFIQPWFWKNFNEWEADKDGRVYALSADRSRGIHFPSSRYTDSIDSALTLVPSECKRMDTMWNDGSLAVIIERKFEAQHKIPSIAICIASLKARNYDR